MSDLPKINLSLTIEQLDRTLDALKLAWEEAPDPDFAADVKRLAHVFTHAESHWRARMARPERRPACDRCPDTPAHRALTGTPS